VALATGTGVPRRVIGSRWLHHSRPRAPPSHASAAVLVNAWSGDRRAKKKGAEPWGRSGARNRPVRPPLDGEKPFRGASVGVGNKGTRRGVEPVRIEFSSTKGASLSAGRLFRRGSAIWRAHDDPRPAHPRADPSGRVRVRMARWRALHPAAPTCDSGQSGACRGTRGAFLATGKKKGAGAVLCRPSAQSPPLWGDDRGFPTGGMVGNCGGSRENSLRRPRFHGHRAFSTAVSAWPASLHRRASPKQQPRRASRVRPSWLWVGWVPPYSVDSVRTAKRTVPAGSHVGAGTGAPSRRSPAAGSGGARSRSCRRSRPAAWS
jgi:hypothetical protein